jgi:CRP-like cAMP-binding protein
MKEDLAEMITHHGLLAGLPPEDMELIAGCAKNVAFDADDLLLEEGAVATTFYLVRRGNVAIEVHQAGRGPLVIETIGPGGAVGWSWLFSPHRWHFDARALEDVGAISIDGACLRTKAEADPAFGYELIKRFAALIIDRLEATQLRLLDIYGDVEGR